MRRPLLIIAGLSFLIFLACGGTSSVEGGGPSTGPTPTATATSTPGPEAVQSYLTLQLAPGFYYNPYTDDHATGPLSDYCVGIGGCFPHVDCSNVDWAAMLVNAAPDGRPVGPADWQTVTGSADVYGTLTPGAAPNITVSPASGTLAPGAQVLVHITGSFTGGPLFAVHFFDPRATISTTLELKCPPYA
jgi:hypothetical protein